MESSYLYKNRKVSPETNVWNEFHAICLSCFVDDDPTHQVHKHHHYKTAADNTAQDK